jgi:hypothetical protein
MGETPPTDVNNETGPGGPEEAPGHFEGGGGIRLRRLVNDHLGELLVGLVLIVAAAALTPLGGFLLEAGDGARDFVRRAYDYDAGQVDDLRERVQDRPYWQESPEFLERSMALLEDHADQPLVSIGDTSVDLSPSVITVDDLVRRGVEYEGRPVVVIGRMKSYSSLTGSNIDFGTEEALLEGKDPGSFIIAGNVGTGASPIPTEASLRSVVALVGVPVAVGRIRAVGNPIGEEAVYFASSYSTMPTRDNPVVGQEVEALERRTDPGEK